MGPASFGKAHPALTLQCFIEIQDEKAKVPPASDEVLGDISVTWGRYRFLQKSIPKNHENCILMPAACAAFLAARPWRAGAWMQHRCREARMAVTLGKSIQSKLQTISIREGLQGGNLRQLYDRSESTVLLYTNSNGNRLQF